MAPEQFVPVCFPCPTSRQADEITFKLLQAKVILECNSLLHPSILISATPSVHKNLLSMLLSETEGLPMYTNVIALLTRVFPLDQSLASISSPQDHGLYIYLLD